MTKLTISNLSSELDSQSQRQIYGGDANQYATQKITKGGRTVNFAYSGVDAGDRDFDALTVIARPGETAFVNYQDIEDKAFNTPSNVAVYI